MPELSPEDGVYSCPLGLLFNLFSINELYGEIE